VSDAATRHLVRWIDDRTPPPTFPPLTMEARDPHDAIVRDEHGVALGGVRLPEVEVPVAVQVGSNTRPGEARNLLGERTPFDDATLAGLYPDTDAYLREWDAAVDRIVAARGVLDDDADALRERGREIAGQSL